MSRFASSRKPSLCLWFLLFVFLSPLLSQGGTSSAQSSQESKRSDEEVRAFYRIDVEDPIEAGLIQQQLKIKPEMVRTGSFYFYGSEDTIELLRRYAYQPVRMNREDVLSRVVVVRKKNSEEEDLLKTGVTIVLREREYWVVRGTLAQLRLLERLGYPVEELGRREPRPRQIRVVVSKREQVAEVGGLRVDIYSATKSEKGYVVLGGAFDDSIDELRAAGFKVEILADPPGAIR